MHAIDIVQVTRNKKVKKRFPQGRGVGGTLFQGSENRDQDTPDLLTASIVLQRTVIFCKHLRQLLLETRADKR